MEAGEELHLPEITPDDVMALNRALAEGYKVSDPLLCTGELACFNLARACELEMPEDDVKKCARTVLEISVATGGVDILGMMPAVRYALDLLTADELGELAYGVSMKMGDASMFGGGEPEQAVRDYERAAVLAQDYKHPEESVRSWACARALAGAGRARGELGDHASAIARLRQALDVLPPLLEGNTPTAGLRADWLLAVGRELMEIGDGDAALKCVSEAAAMHRERAGAESRAQLSLAEALRRLWQVHIENCRAMLCAELDAHYAQL